MTVLVIRAMSGWWAFMAAVQKQWVDFKHDLRDRRNKWLAKMVYKLCSIPQVQLGLARAFEGQTPMCSVFRDAASAVAEGVMEDYEANASDINGLEHEIEKSIDQLIRDGIDADNINNIERVVEGCVRDYLEADNRVLKEEISSMVVEELVERLQGK